MSAIIAVRGTAIRNKKFVSDVTTWVKLVALIGFGRVTGPLRPGAANALCTKSIRERIVNIIFIIACRYPWNAPPLQKLSGKDSPSSGLPGE